LNSQRRVWEAYYLTGEVIGRLEGRKNWKTNWAILSRQKRGKTVPIESPPPKNITCLSQEKKGGGARKDGDCYQRAEK